MHSTKSSATECATQILTTFPLIVRELWNRLQAEAVVAVTPNQLGLFSLLGNRRFTLTGLARKAGVSPPAMSKMISLLVLRGWVHREEDPTDRRRKLLSLTPTGQKVFQRVNEAMRQNIANSLDELDDEQRAQIVSSLELLVQTLLQPDRQITNHNHQL